MTVVLDVVVGAVATVVVGAVVLTVAWLAWCRRVNRVSTHGGILPL